jgi:hypothetical protein
MLVCNKRGQAFYRKIHTVIIRSLYKSTWNLNVYHHRPERLFPESFRQVFTKTRGTNCKFSIVFHPETGGLAKQVNNTIQTS